MEETIIMYSTYSFSGFIEIAGAAFFLFINVVYVFVLCYDDFK